MEAKRLIRKSGFTQRELARFLDMDEAEFSKKLSGWRGKSFTAEEIKTLAFHGVPVAELFPASDAIGQVVPQP